MTEEEFSEIWDAHILELELIYGRNPFTSPTAMIMQVETRELAHQLFISKPKEEFSSKCKDVEDHMKLYMLKKKGWF